MGNRNAKVQLSISCVPDVCWNTGQNAMSWFHHSLSKGSCLQALLKTCVSRNIKILPRMLSGCSTLLSCCYFTSSADHMGSGRCGLCQVSSSGGVAPHCPCCCFGLLGAQPPCALTNNNVFASYWREHKVTGPGAGQR